MCWCRLRRWSWSSRLALEAGHRCTPALVGHCEEEVLAKGSEIAVSQACCHATRDSRGDDGGREGEDGEGGLHCDVRWLVLVVVL